MNEPQGNPLAPTATIPQQVWATLTPSQQKLILQTIVQICQRLMMQQTQEQNNEPATNQALILQ